MSDLTSACQTARRLEDAVRTVVRGQDAALRNILASLAAGGHVLVEDVPGTGKTTLAKAIARAVDGAGFKRVQFTPDILLADEINRASPRTQSALLEAMAERQATIDGERHDLNGLFFVIATQNPVEFRGTYPLPEAQMDRFMVQSRLGYVTPEEERAILSDQIDTHPVDRLEPVINRDDLVGLLNATRTVRISDELRGYIVDIVSATRGRDDVQLAASPRASIALMKMAQALSLFEGREFVVPETIQTVAADVIAHRMVIAPEAKLSGVTGRQVVADILQEVPAPV